jgi:hypothetical protein
MTAGGQARASGTAPEGLEALEELGAGGVDLPVRVAKPPEYARRGTAGTFGRKIRAEKVEAPTDPTTRRSPEKAPGDLDPGDRKVVEEGREIDADLGRGIGSSQDVRRPPLSATEMEKRISRYSESLDRLTTAEKRLVREYYRLLRDLEE